jgi:hypothetical protein
LKNFKIATEGRLELTHSYSQLKSESAQAGSTVIAVLVDLHWQKQVLADCILTDSRRGKMLTTTPGGDFSG